MQPIEQLKCQIADLQAKIIEAHPMMPSILSVIHKNLQEDPELVTLLDESEIQVIVSGLLKQTNINITTKATKQTSKTLAKASLGSLGLGGLDLDNLKIKL